jgi:hypothetical protein
MNPEHDTPDKRVRRLAYACLKHGVCKSLGGGWFEFPHGVRVQGRRKIAERVLTRIERAIRGY